MIKHLLIFLLFCSTIISQVKEYTIEQCLNLSLANSKELKISRAMTESLRADVIQNTSMMLPNIFFKSSYTRLSDIPPFQVNIPFLGQTIKIQDPVLNNYGFQLSVQQPLFTGFKLLSLRSASKSMLKSQEAHYQNEQNEVAYATYSAFWGIYKLQKLNELIRKNLERISEHITNAENYLINGLITKNELLKLKVQYANTEYKLIDSENTLKIARLKFNRLLGIDLESNTAVLPYEISLIVPNKNEKLIEEAFNNRNDLRAVELEIAASQDKMTAAESAWYPQLSLFGNYYYNKPNQRVLPIEEKYYDTWDVGIVLSWSIWNWGYTSAQVSKAEQNLIILQTKESLKKEDIKIDYYNKYFDMVAGIKKIDAAQITLDQASENHRMLVNKFNNHLASSSDLIDADTDLLNAEIQLITSKIEFEVSRLAFKLAVGQKLYGE